MKKILLVSPYYRDSYKNHISMGSAVKIAANLSRIYQVKVLTTGRQTNLEKENKNLSIESVPGFLFPDPVNYMVSFRLLSRFSRMLTEYQPDVVIVSKYMFFSSFVIPIAKKRGFRTITVTDTFPGINWFSQSKITSAVMWVYARVIGVPLLRISDKVVLLYPGLEKIAGRYGLDYITIPNGVDAGDFTPVAPPADIRKPKGQFWVGFVGRPESAKGYDVAQRIADNFTDNPKIKFIFVGDPWASGSSGNRIYLGFRRDIMRIYRLFDCLILPSRAEGLPNVVMEAMSQAVPVIASTVGGVKYIIRDRQNGILVPPQSVSDFSSALTELVKNKKFKNKLGISARKTVMEKYNWSKIIIGYRQLINQLCAV